MRRIVLAVAIAATAASPVFAQSARELRQAAREKRVEKSDANEPGTEQRERKVQPRERRDQPRTQLRQPNFAPTDVERPSRPVIDRAVERGRPSTFGDRPRRIDQPRGDNQDSVANWRRAQRDQARDRRQEGLADWVRRQRVTPPAEARPDRPAPPPRTVAHRGNTPRWRSSWHNDRRYDWRDHRRRHRSLFRLNFYFDPFGWSYRRYQRGWRLWPSYYDSSYWLRDPSMYRLPYAPYPYKWVRYWNDALLVDTYTGQVVDVVHDFFWS